MPWARTVRNVGVSDGREGVHYQEMNDPIGALTSQIR